TGRRGCSRRSDFSSSKPPSPGRRTSDTSTAGAAPVSACLTSSAEANRRTAWPASCSALSMTQRSAGSSSTTQISGVLAFMLLFQGEYHGEDGGARRAHALDEAGVAVHELLRDGEPEARAAGLARDQRREDARQQRRLDAGAVVGDLDTG